MSTHLPTLIGPLWVRAMLQDRPISDAFVERTLAAALQPWRVHPTGEAG